MRQTIYVPLNLLMACIVETAENITQERYGQSFEDLGKARMKEIFALAVDLEFAKIETDLF